MTIWPEQITKAGLSDEVQKVLLDGGYDSVFAHAFTEAPGLERWLSRLQSKLPAVKDLDADEWLTHPTAAKLRILWHDVRGTTTRTTLPTASPTAAVTSALLPIAAGAKLSTADRDKMRKDVEAKYPGHVFSPDTLPAMGLLQAIKGQCAGGHWEWIPWKRLLSEAAAQEVRAKKSVDDDLLHLVADSMGVSRDERSGEVSGSAFRIQCVLETRGNAFVMCGACHLGSWATYVKKFLAHYTRKTVDYLRPPSGAEAEEADRAAVQAIFDLCFDGANMDDAIHEIVVVKDLLRHHLVPQPKVLRTEQKPKPVEGKGQGKGNKRRAAPTGPDSGIAGKRPRTGECWQWIQGNCAEASCRYKHACAKCGSSQHGSPSCTKGKVQWSIDMLQGAKAPSSKEHPDVRVLPQVGQAAPAGVLRADACQSHSNVAAVAGARVKLRDGGGIESDGDWCSPRELDLCAELRQLWWSRVLDWDMAARLQAHVLTCNRDSLLSEEESQTLRSDLCSFLNTQGFACCDTIADGQPLALELLKGLLLLWNDVDITLPDQLQAGVSTGVLEPIPPSGVWRETEIAEKPPLELLICDEPWQSARDDPELLQQLVQADVDDGFADWLAGGLTEAKERWEHCGAGKFGIVKKEGSAPRLIGDSSISNVNGQCQIRERIELPGLCSVSAFLSRHADQDWTAFSLDFSKAHKRVKIKPSEQGLSLFAVPTPAGDCRWVYYKTAHFGASWASFWWARVAGAFVRLGHRLLHFAHFLAIYVDDAFALLPRRVAGPMACLLIFLGSALNFPMSWHKLAFGQSLQWIGWRIELDASPSAVLPCEKAEAMRLALDQLCRQPKRVARKVLRTLVGRLVWFCSAAHWLRPWLQLWFHALNKPALHFLHLDAVQLEELRNSVDARCKVLRPCALSDILLGWRILEIGGRPVPAPSNLLSAPLKQGRAWVKLGEPEPSLIHLTRDEQRLALFFKQLLEHPGPIPLVEEAGPSCVAAADAFADANICGIGGWFLPPGAVLHPRNVFYFSFLINKDELPAWFVASGKPLQRYIAALEALAQLVLLSCQQQTLSLDGGLRWVSLRQSCDNAGVVSASNKGMSMQQPLAGVLQAIALFAARHQLLLRMTHVAGTRNEWADTLSRGLVSNPLWDMLDPSKQMHPDWLALLNLAHELLDAPVS